MPATFLVSNMHNKETDIIFLNLPSNLMYLCPYLEKNLIRLGIDTDGGYIVPSQLIFQTDFLLSFGLGSDWSFEEDFSKQRPNVPIHLYDGAGTRYFDVDLEKKSAYNKFFSSRAQHFVEMVGKKEGHTSFRTAVERTNASEIFVKMDIEGDEFDCIDELLAQHNKIIGMSIEFHWIWGDRERFEHTMHKINQYYKIVHVHGCNYGRIADDMLPDVLEISFIRKDLAKSDQRRPMSYISNLDFPNNASKPDFCLLFDLSSTEPNF